MLNHDEWVESEFKKWEEKYDIPFESEFMVKAIIDLQYQYHKTDAHHIKTKNEILQTIAKIQRDLILKKKVKYNNPLNILMKAPMHRGIAQMLIDMIGENNINSKLLLRDKSTLKTDNFIIEIAPYTKEDSLRGKKYDYIFEMK